MLQFQLTNTQILNVGVYILKERQTYGNSISSHLGSKVGSSNTSCVSPTTSKVYEIFLLLLTCDSTLYNLLFTFALLGMFLEKFLSKIKNKSACFLTSNPKNFKFIEVNYFARLDFLV